MGDSFDTSDGRINQEPNSTSHQPEFQTSGQQQSAGQPLNQPQGSQPAGQPQAYPYPASRPQGYPQQPGQPQAYQQQPGQAQGYQHQVNQPHGYPQSAGGYHYQQAQYSGQTQGNINQAYTYQQSGGQGDQPGNKGLAIASMVCGIVSLCLFCIGYISLPGAIVGLVLGLVSLKKKAGGREMAIAGVVTSIIALALYLLLVIGVWGCMGCTTGIVNEMFNNMYYY